MKSFFFSAGFTSGAKPWSLKGRTIETALVLLLETRKLCFAIFDLLNLNILDLKKNISFCVTSHWIFYAALAKYKNPIKVCGGGDLPQKVLISFLLYWASVRWQEIPLLPQTLALYFEILNTDLESQLRKEMQNICMFPPLPVLPKTEKLISRPVTYVHLITDRRTFFQTDIRVGQKRKIHDWENLNKIYVFSSSKDVNCD